MPKAKKPFDPWEKSRGALIGRMMVLEIGYVDVAEKLNVTAPTARRYIKDPGRMSLDQMRCLNRALDITAEAARELLAYK